MTFVFDPANPFPTRGGQNLIYSYDPFDQRKMNEDRSDYLAFATDPLAGPLEVTGRAKVRLFISTDVADTDFTAKLPDIYPRGRRARDPFARRNLPREYRNGKVIG